MPTASEYVKKPIATPDRFLCSVSLKAKLYAKPAKNKSQKYATLNSNRTFSVKPRNNPSMRFPRGSDFATPISNHTSSGSQNTYLVPTRSKYSNTKLGENLSVLTSNSSHSESWDTNQALRRSNLNSKSSDRWSAPISDISQPGSHRTYRVLICATPNSKSLRKSNGAKLVVPNIAPLDVQLLKNDLSILKSDLISSVMKFRQAKFTRESFKSKMCANLPKNEKEKCLSKRVSSLKSYEKVPPRPSQSNRLDKRISNRFSSESRNTCEVGSRLEVSRKMRSPISITSPSKSRAGYRVPSCLKSKTNSCQKLSTNNSSLSEKGIQNAKNHIDSRAKMITKWSAHLSNLLSSRNRDTNRIGVNVESSTGTPSKLHHIQESQSSVVKSGEAISMCDTTANLRGNSKIFRCGSVSKLNVINLPKKAYVSSLFMCLLAAKELGFSKIPVWNGFNFSPILESSKA